MYDNVKYINKKEKLYIIMIVKKFMKKKKI